MRHSSIELDFYKYFHGFPFIGFGSRSCGSLFKQFENFQYFINKTINTNLCIKIYTKFCVVCNPSYLILINLIYYGLPSVLQHMI